MTRTKRNNHQSLQQTLLCCSKSTRKRANTTIISEYFA